MVWECELWWSTSGDVSFEHPFPAFRRGSKGGGVRTRLSLIIDPFLSRFSCANRCWSPSYFGSDVLGWSHRRLARAFNLLSHSLPLSHALSFSPDIRSALLYISETYPDAPLFGCGFSLGASVLARFIGEEGDHCVLRAGVVVGTPWDCVGMCKRFVLSLTSLSTLNPFLQSRADLTVSSIQARIDLASEDVLASDGNQHSSRLELSRQLPCRSSPPTRLPSLQKHRYHQQNAKSSA